MNEYTFDFNGTEVRSVYTEDMMKETIAGIKASIPGAAEVDIGPDYAAKREFIGHTTRLAGQYPGKLLYLLQQGSPLMILNAHGREHKGQWYYFENNKPVSDVRYAIRRMVDWYEAKAAIVLACNPEGVTTDLPIPAITPIQDGRHYNSSAKDYRMQLLTPFPVPEQDIKLTEERKKVAARYVDLLEKLDRELEGQPTDLKEKPSASWNVIFGNNFRDARTKLGNLFPRTSPVA